MRIVLLGVITAVVLGSFLAMGKSAPQLINMQGRLTDSAGAPLDGVNVDLTLKFYGSESGTTVLLNVLEAGVAVDKGQYKVLIGGGTITAGAESDLASVFRNHGDVWTSVQVNADAEMSPRLRVTSVPYALAVDTAWLTTFHNTPDYDGDGHPKACVCDGSTAAVDCDDGNADVYPGAPEPCMSCLPGHHIQIGSLLCGHCPIPLHCRDQ